MRISCPAAVADVFKCPTRFELLRQILALLPRGRAWQSHEDVHEIEVSGDPAQVGTFQIDRTGLGTEAFAERLTTMQRYWLAFAIVLEYLHTRACQLIEEMFCETTAELRGEWGFEYGFPDPCEPWESLCGKVRALGGARCEYFQALAAARGWDLTCHECVTTKGARAGCARAGCARPCGCPRNEVYFIVRLSTSPSYVAPAVTRARARCARAGVARTCGGPDISQLICLIERFRPAHVKTFYESAAA